MPEKTVCASCFLIVFFLCVLSYRSLGSRVKQEMLYLLLVHSVESQSTSVTNELGGSKQASCRVTTYIG